MPPGGFGHRLGARLHRATDPAVRASGITGFTTFTGFVRPQQAVVKVYSDRMPGLSNGVRHLIERRRSSAHVRNR